MLEYSFGYFRVPYLRLGISGIISILDVVNQMIWSLIPEITSDVRLHLILWVTRNFGFPEVLGIPIILGNTRNFGGQI